jgi:hypothetical protein
MDALAKRYLDPNVKMITDAAPGFRRLSRLFAQQRLLPGQLRCKGDRLELAERAR